LKFFEDRVEGFLGEALICCGFLEDFVGSIALGLDWSGKSMNHFVGWGFFSSGWIEIKFQIGCQVGIL
jgi:hypothetical protein